MVWFIEGAHNINLKTFTWKLYVVKIFVFSLKKKKILDIFLISQR